MELRKKVAWIFTGVLVVPVLIIAQNHKIEHLFGT
jgi:uncharacterized membrane protein